VLSASGVDSGVELCVGVSSGACRLLAVEGAARAVIAERMSASLSASLFAFSVTDGAMILLVEALGITLGKDLVAGGGWRVLLGKPEARSTGEVLYSSCLAWHNHPL